MTRPSEKIPLKIQTCGCKKKPVETTASNNNYAETMSTEVIKGRRFLFFLNYCTLKRRYVTTTHSITDVLCSEFERPSKMTATKDKQTRFTQ